MAGSNLERRRNMKKALVILGLIITIPCLAFAQSGHSPYAGQEKREIKALSAEDIEGYLTGQGMGFAKAAELNHYPGGCIKRQFSSAEK
jgi:hypothetical protein